MRESRLLMSVVLLNLSATAFVAPFTNSGGLATKVSSVARQSTIVKPEIETRSLSTPLTGVVHPLAPFKIFDTPAQYLQWRLSVAANEAASSKKFPLAPNDAPRVAVLLNRDHMQQRYITDLLTIFEKQGLIPVPIFTEDTKAHVVVELLLTSTHKNELLSQGFISDETFRAQGAVAVDAIVNTNGYLLVGGSSSHAKVGHSVEVAQHLLAAMDVPYIVAGPLLKQQMMAWKFGGVSGDESVGLYSLPELDGAIDTVVLGAMVRGRVALIPERVRKLTDRVSKWVKLRRTPVSERKIAVAVYNYPPGLGSVGTAAMLNVPKSLESLLQRLAQEGYDLGDWSKDSEASGESLIAALTVLTDDSVTLAGSDKMQDVIDQNISRAYQGDSHVVKTLAKSKGGLGGAKVRSKNLSMQEVESMMGSYMGKKVMRIWGQRGNGPGITRKGETVVSGLQIGNVFLFSQPMTGVETTGMGLIFSKQYTPPPQYCAIYEWVRQSDQEGGIGSNAIIHFG